MTEPINLTHGPIKLQALKHDLTDGYEADCYGQSWFVSKEAVLALIDIAEAAPKSYDTFAMIQAEALGDCEPRRIARWCEDAMDALQALARTTTNP